MQEQECGTIPLTQIGNGAFYRGDCVQAMREMLDGGLGGTFHAVVTDPPYGIGFMGRDWDSERTVAFKSETWKLALQLLRPGGHLLAFGGSRTYHRLACAVEDAGFEVRDQIMWLYGQGMGSKGKSLGSGWNTTLKPANEPILMARKPFTGTVKANMAAYSCGGINVDGCRVAANGRRNIVKKIGQPNREGTVCYGNGLSPGSFANGLTNRGRWPANVIHDGTCEVLEAFDAFGIKKSGSNCVKRKSGSDASSNTSTAFGAESRPAGTPMVTYGDTGSASRFFYSAKASKKDRVGKHPTQKPNSLMRYLCRLVTPPGGIVMDPFSGSGTTLEAAITEGFHAVGCEITPEYWPDIERRLHRCQPDLHS